MAIYIGLDVHSQQITYHAIDEQKEILKKGRIRTDATSLAKFCDTMLSFGEEVHVAMESGGMSRWVTRTLLHYGVDAHVYHAAEVAAKRSKKEYKNDANDARDLAHGLLTGVYEMEVYMPTDEAFGMRQDTVQRQHFVEIRMESQILAKCLLRSRRLEVPKNLDYSTAWERLLQEHAGTELGFFLEMHFQTFLHAEKMIKLLEDRMHETSTSNPEMSKNVDHLKTIPGVGFLTAYALLGVIGELSRFPSSAQLSSYLGLVPRSYDSGNRRQTGHITRSGPWYLRKLLCQCAQHARSRKNPLSAYFYAVRARSGSDKKAIVAVMHRIVRIAFQLLKKQEDFDPQQLNIREVVQGEDGTTIWRMGRIPSPPPSSERSTNSGEDRMRLKVHVISLEENSAFEKVENF